MLIGAGCASYDKTGWYTPDSVNFTYASDFHSTPTYYFGSSWTIKK